MLKKIINKFFDIHPNAMSFKNSIDLAELPVVTFYQGSKKINFLLDTGSNNCIIDSTSLKSLKHQPLDITNKVSGIEGIESEVMVSDFEGTASKVDVVMRTNGGNVWLFDIKTASKFDRAYCSLQLSVYKTLYEKCYGGTVCGMFVLGTNSRRTFRIIEQEDSKVQKLLDMNKGA